MHRILSFAILLCLVQGASAREGKLEVRFLAERIPNDMGPVVLVAEETRTDPFDLPMNNLSPPQTPPAREFRLLATTHNRAIATVRLPEEGDSFVALLVTSANGGYETVVMPYQNPKFRPGDIYFHNLADKTVLGHVGTAKFVLPAGQSTVLTPQGARAEKFYDVGLGVREPEGNRVLTTTRWPQDNLARFYVFFFVDPQTKRITHRAVDEFVEIDQPAP
jgi:hypothetical protein